MESGNDEECVAFMGSLESWIAAMKATSILFAAGLVLAAHTAAVAQMPARNGNVWDGKSHEPPAGAVQSNENSAGVAPPAGQQQKENDFVENQAKALVDKTHRDVGEAPKP